MQQSRVNIVDADGKIVFGPPLKGGGLTLGRQFEMFVRKLTVPGDGESAENGASANQGSFVQELFRHLADLAQAQRAEPVGVADGDALALA